MTSEMNDENEVATPTFQGSEQAVLSQLWSLAVDDVDTEAVFDAIRSVQAGERLVICAGERFEVRDPEWSIVQDVYGCERGRDCTEVTDEQRVRFEALIAQREAGG